MSKAKAWRVEQILEERGRHYGDNFASLAATIQQLKETMRGASSWPKLTADKKEALDLIATKIGRIVCGNPEYKDSWDDIGGYAKLIADTLDAE